MRLKKLHKYILYAIIIIIIVYILNGICFNRVFEGFAEAPTFHILIASSGRPSLVHMTNSLKDELNENDALTIVFDGPDAKEKSGITDEWTKDYKCKVNIFEQIPAVKSWGHDIRNKYQGILDPETTFVMHADDDDTYIPGSFDKLREICTDPDTLYITKMRRIYKDGRPDDIIPRQNKDIKGGDISSQNGVIPRAIATMGVWENHYGGDFKYYEKLQESAPKIVFLDLIIYRIEMR
jgi:hypothetical protein